MCAFNVILLLAVLSLGPAGDEPPTTNPSSAPASAPAASPEDALWQQVLTLQAEVPTSQPQSAWFEATRRRRQALVEKLRLYLTLYPGGARRVEAVRFELAALHELCVLDAGASNQLCTRVRELLRHQRPDDPIVWEAAYWEIQCRRLERGAASTQPATRPVLEPDEELLSAYWQYVTDYPHSPHVPRMADVLFEHAAESGDDARLQRLLHMLKDGFADHVVTASLTARWERRQAVGHPVWLMFDEPDGTRVDTRGFDDRPVLIVVWAAASADARRCVSRVEQFRQTHPQLAVVGVNLDMSRELMTAACKELGVDWPQFNDGLGPANRFVREWGVRRTPCVFVIDRRGRLAGSCGDADWEQLAIKVLDEKSR